MVGCKQLLACCCLMALCHSACFTWYAAKADRYLVLVVVAFCGPFWPLSCVCMSLPWSFGSRQTWPCFCPSDGFSIVLALFTHTHTRANVPEQQLFGFQGVTLTCKHTPVCVLHKQVVHCWKVLQLVVVSRSCKLGVDVGEGCRASGQACVVARPPSVCSSLIINHDLYTSMPRRLCRVLALCEK